MAYIGLPANCFVKIILLLIHMNSMYDMCCAERCRLSNNGIFKLIDAEVAYEICIQLTHDVDLISWDPGKLVIAQS